VPEDLNTLAEKLNMIVKLLAGKKCECYCDEELDNLVKELQETVNLLIDWATKAGMGVIGRDVEG